MNLNNIYDPNATGTGHQPMFHDELAAVYGRYRVVSALVKFTISNANTPVRWGVAAYNTPPTDLLDLREYPGSKSGILAAMSSGQGVQSVVMSVQLSKLLGENVQDDRDQAVFGSAPSNYAYFGTFVVSLDNATDISSLNYTFDITYNVECFDRKSVTGS
jgi:hypothetical protein